jgi:NAD(P)-dependent dehydrogenase (short-subunit alcohol dehydrogenase family)
VSGRLEDKVALISGSGGGQGRAAVLRFAAEGARVVCCDVNQQGNDETVEMARAAGGDVVGYAPADSATSIGADKWIADAVALHGRIDILYNNASTTRFTPIASISDEEWRFVMKNEIDVVFYPTRAAWPHLIASAGVIINISSIVGMIGWGRPAVAHCTTKGAIIAMTRQLAVEGAPHGIRAVAISPGPIVTPTTAEILERPEVKARMLERNLIGRLGQPDDVVSAALFLASDEGSFITGANLPVDGGYTAF